MKIKKLPFLMAYTICLELVLSPLPAIAADNTAAQAALGLMNAATQSLSNNTNAAQSNSKFMYDKSLFMQDRAGKDDGQFNYSKLIAIPGMQEYLSKKGINPQVLDCKTLSTMVSVPKGGVCEEGKISTISGVPAATQAAEAEAYRLEFELTKDTYVKYLADDNPDKALYGKACMNRLMNVILPGFFNDQEETVKALRKEIEGAKKIFENNSLNDLKAIKMATVELNGSGSAFNADLDDAEKKNLEFSRNLGGAACNSMFTNDGLNAFSKGSGLLGIQEQVKTNVEKKSNSGYNAADYTTDAAKIEKEIRTMADDVSEQSKLNFASISIDKDGLSKFIAKVPSLTNSTTGVRDGLTANIFSDVQKSYLKTRIDLDDKVLKAQEALGTERAKNAIEQLTNIHSDSAFNAQLSSIENKMKNDCLASSNIDEPLSRINNPKLSKTANKQARELIIKRVKAIMAQANLTPASKKAEIAKITMDPGNIVSRDTSYEDVQLNEDGTVARKTVAANEIVTPNTYMNSIFNNCEAQFAVNPLNGRASGRDTIQALRSLKKEFKKASDDTAAALRKSIIDERVNCKNDQATINASKVNTCSSQSFDFSSAGYCAKGAEACALNMNKCNEKVKARVSNVTAARDTKRKVFNKNVDDLRLKLVGLVSTIENKLSASAKYLSTAFGVRAINADVFPEDLPADKKFMKSFQQKGDEIQVADYEAYLNKANDHLTDLSNHIADQKKELTAPGGILAAHIATTTKNYQNEISRLDSLITGCKNAIQDHKDGIKAGNEALAKDQGELGQKSGELCSVWSAVMTNNNPNQACDRPYVNLTKEVVSAAAKSGKNLQNEVNSMTRDLDERCAGLAKGTENAREICSSGVPLEFKTFYQTQTSKDFDKQCQVIWDCSVPDPYLLPIKGTSEKQAKTNAQTAINNLKNTSKIKYSCSPPIESDDGWISVCQEPSPCDSIEQNITSVYKSGIKQGLVHSTSLANSMPSFCPSNDTSGGNKDMNNLLKTISGDPAAPAQTHK